MGQKTHPIGFRLGVIKTWQSNWYSDKNMADLLQEDLMIRRYVKSRLTRAGISKVEIARAPQKATITIHTARPGIVIGRKGAEVDKLRDELQHLTKKEVYVNIQEIRRPELDAQLIGDSVARQIEQRISFRRAMKKSITAAMRMGAEGIKITCGGRLGGALRESCLGVFDRGIETAFGPPARQQGDPRYCGPRKCSIKTSREAPCGATKWHQILFRHG